MERIQNEYIVIQHVTSSLKTNNIHQHKRFFTECIRFRPTCIKTIEKLANIIKRFVTLYKMFIFLPKYNKFIENKQESSAYMKIHTKCIYFSSKVLNKPLEH